MRRGGRCHGALLLGVPALTAGERKLTADGEFAGLTDWEDSVLALCAELMESTGKPMIHVPDSAIRGSVFDYGKKYRPIVLSSYRAAAQALDRMEWYAAHRRDHSP